MKLREVQSPVTFLSVDSFFYHTRSQKWLMSVFIKNVGHFQLISAHDPFQ